MFGLSTGVMYDAYYHTAHEKSFNKMYITSNFRESQ